MHKTRLKSGLQSQVEMHGRFFYDFNSKYQIFWLEILKQAENALVWPFKIVHFAVCWWLQNSFNSLLNLQFIEHKVLDTRLNGHFGWVVTRLSQEREVCC